MKVGPKSSLRPFLHGALQLYTKTLFQTKLVPKPYPLAMGNTYIDSVKSLVTWANSQQSHCFSFNWTE